MLFRGIPAVIAIATCALVSTGAIFVSRPLLAVNQDSAGAAPRTARTLALAPVSFSHSGSHSGEGLHIRGPEVPEELPVEPSLQRQTVEVERGDTLAALLYRAGVGPEDARSAISVLKKHYDPRRIKAGQKISITTEHKAEDDKGGRLLGFSLAIDRLRELSVARNLKGDLEVFERQETPQRVVQAARGTIESSLYAAADRASVPIPAIVALIRAFSWDVDFQRDIQPGNRFEVMYENFVDKAGESVDSGDVIYAALTLGKRKHTLYRYTKKNGTSGYYTETGENARKALLRTPVDGARLSSGFGRRRHPILGYSRMHRGVDFAAPRGTPIYAAGDGVVKFAGRKGGYGKYVRIHHNGTYSTAYAHMSRIAKGLRPGKRVKQGQKIGYVGSTGRSTGPHLHYEILKKGQQINPLKVKMLSSPRLAGQELKRFQAHVAKTNGEFAALADEIDVAVASEER
jgi:murein DD-endopeptidase MepM/ murein hydrolase activator NlpD